MTLDELHCARNLVPKYVEHVREKTLIAKIYGLFTIKVQHYNAVHVMVMENTLQLRNEANLERIFDLKGSMVNRYVEIPDLVTPTGSKPLKDKNWLELKFQVPYKGKRRKKLLATMKRDVDFFKELGLLDYSLLLGIETLTEADPHMKNTDHQQRIGNKLYHIAMIDFMQVWNFSKKIENALKTKIMRQSKTGISAIEPQAYADRFYKFMSREVFIR